MRSQTTGLTEGPLSNKEKRFTSQQSTNPDLIVLDQTRTRNTKPTFMGFFNETPLNDNYMAVIRESHQSVMSRHELNA
jgi:hypothetical protein